MGRYGGQGVELGKRVWLRTAQMEMRDSGTYFWRAAVAQEIRDLD